MDILTGARQLSIGLVALFPARATTERRHAILRDSQLGASQGLGSSRRAERLGRGPSVVGERIQTIADLPCALAHRGGPAGECIDLVEQGRDTEIALLELDGMRQQSLFPRRGHVGIIASPVLARMRARTATWPSG